MIKYSPSSHACYDMDLNYSNLPCDLIEISGSEYLAFSNPPPDGKRVVKHAYPFEFEDIPELTPDQLANTAQSEMVNELTWCDLQVKLHQSSDSRAVTTLENIFAYARSCRDYVGNIEGSLTIVGDKPSRPE